MGILYVKVGRGMSKDVCPKEYVIGNRGKTVSLFLNEILGKFEV